MNKILALTLALLPSFLHKWVRRILGQSIDSTAYIGFGSIVFGTKLVMGPQSRIGPFVIIRTVDLNLGTQATLKPLSIYSCYSLTLSDDAQISSLCVISAFLKKSAVLSIGKHSRVFPLCWIEPGEGVTIGSHVGIGGQGLIFTHGVWPDYLHGGPIAFGPVVIEDNVWIPWRVFILPNVTIGKNAIIGAGAVINKSVPANVLAGGVPVKVIKDNIGGEISQDEKLKRSKLILSEFVKNQEAPGKNVRLSDDGLTAFIDKQKISLRPDEELYAGDIRFIINNAGNNLVPQTESSIIVHEEKVLYLAPTRQDLAKEFLSFLRRFGIRLSVHVMR